MIRRTLCLVSLSAASFAAAQTQMPNSVKIGNEGITITSIPATAIIQFGTSSAPGVWTAPASIPANELPLLVSCATSTSCAELSSKGDPDPNVLKEIDAQEGTTAYDVHYTDASGNAQVVHVPALPSTSQIVPPTPGGVYPLVVSNIQPLSGSPAVPVLSLFQVQPSTLVGGVLSNFSWNVTINGVTLNCVYGSMDTSGNTTMSCVVPTTSTN
jgi:hypothetical protein